MGSNQKGAAFERDFCRMLSNWWTDGMDDSVFWRTSQSGGRATQRAKSGKTVTSGSGDIAAVHACGQSLLNLITFELKRGYSKFSVADLLDKTKDTSKTIYEDWFEQAESSRRLANTKYWALVVKRDRKKPVIFTQFSDYIHSKPGLVMSFTVDTSERPIYGMSVSHFFDTVPAIRLVESLICNKKPELDLSMVGADI